MSTLGQYLNSILVTPLNLLAGLVRILRTSPLTSVMMVILIFGAGTIGLTMNGAIDRWQESSARRMHEVVGKAGFGLRDVTVEGRHKTSRQALRRAVNTDLGISVFDINLTAVKERLEDLPWVEQANVTRVLPNILHIELTERQAFLLWESEQGTGLIDRSGTVITRSNLSSYDYLPRIRGLKSRIHATAMMDMLEAYPMLRKRMVGAEWVSDRRWTIFLDHGGAVHLPAEEIIPALDLLMEMEAEKQVLAMRGRSIDLRLPDRVVLRAVPLPSPIPNIKTRRRGEDT